MILSCPNRQIILIQLSRCNMRIAGLFFSLLLTNLARTLWHQNHERPSAEQQVFIEGYVIVGKVPIKIKENPKLRPQFPKCGQVLHEECSYCRSNRSTIIATSQLNNFHQLFAKYILFTLARIAEEVANLRFPLLTERVRASLLRFIEPAYSDLLLEGYQ